MIAVVQSRVGLVSVGAAVPERVVTNDEIAQRVATSDEWIVTRTGIRERRVAAPDEYAHDLALRGRRGRARPLGPGAGRRSTSWSARRLRPRLLPVHRGAGAEAVGAHGAGANDLAAACTGLPYALVAGRSARSRPGSRSTRWSSAPTRSPRCSTGTTARPASCSGTAPGRCPLGGRGRRAHAGHRARADGARAGDLSSTRSTRPTAFLRMNGGEVYKFATTDDGGRLDAALLERTALGRSADVDWWIPHQANQRIIDHAVQAPGDRARPRARQSRPIRQHVGRLDPASASKKHGASRTHQAGDRRHDDRIRRRPRVGRVSDGMGGTAAERARRTEGRVVAKVGVLLPGAGIAGGRHGRAMADAFPSAREVFDRAKTRSASTWPSSASKGRSSASRQTEMT